jgi:tRNA 2-thiouridine synthesizing protein A
MGLPRCNVKPSLFGAAPQILKPCTMGNSQILIYYACGIIKMDTMKADKTLDAIGLDCPMPLLKAKKALEAMESGQVLEILGTDEGSKIDLPGWCERVGHAFLGAEEEPDYLKFYIKKG